MARSAFEEFNRIFGMDKEAVCIEIGVAKGFNSLDMLDVRANMKLYLVDKYKPYTSESGNETIQSFHDCCKKEMKERLKAFQGNTEFIEKSSLEASEMFEDETFDFIYIDAEHTYGAITQDIKAWFPKIKKGGVFSGHDFNLEAVNQAVLENFPKITNDTFESSTLKSDWWIIK